MSTRVVGSNSGRSGISEAHDPQRGLVIVETFEGTEAAMRGLANSLDADQSFELDGSNPPLWKCIVSTPNDRSSDTDQNEIENFSWEILSNEEQKSIWQHPLIAGQPVSLIDKVKAQLGQIEDGTITFGAGLSTVRTFCDTLGYSAEVTALVKSDMEFLMRYVFWRGEGASYFDSSYVARLSMIVSSRYAQQISDTNAGRIFTTGELIEEAAAASVPIPGRLQFKLKAIPTQTARDSNGTLDTNYKYGWLKRPSNERQQPSKKVEISIEYWQGTWPIFVYPAVSERTDYA